MVIFCTRDVDVFTTFREILRAEPSTVHYDGFLLSSEPMTIFVTCSTHVVGLTKKILSAGFREACTATRGIGDKYFLVVGIPNMRICSRFERPIKAEFFIFEKTSTPPKVHQLHLHSKEAIQHKNTPDAH